MFRIFISASILSFLIIPSSHAHSPLPALRALLQTKFGQWAFNIGRGGGEVRDAVGSFWYRSVLCTRKNAVPDAILFDALSASEGDRVLSRLMDIRQARNTFKEASRGETPDMIKSQRLDKTFGRLMRFERADEINFVARDAREAFREAYGVTFTPYEFAFLPEGNVLSVSRTSGEMEIWVRAQEKNFRVRGIQKSSDEPILTSAFFSKDFEVGFSGVAAMGQRFRLGYNSPDILLFSRRGKIFLFERRWGSAENPGINAPRNKEYRVEKEWAEVENGGDVIAFDHQYFEGQGHKIIALIEKNGDFNLAQWRQSGSRFNTAKLEKMSHRLTPANLDLPPGSIIFNLRFSPRSTRDSLIVTLDAVSPEEGFVTRSLSLRDFSRVNLPGFSP